MVSKPCQFERRAPIVYRTTITVVPTLTRPYRSTTSWLYMRMQPYETKPPIEPGALVPWIAYSPPERVSAAAPIGLRGLPPGMTSGNDGLSRLTIAGGDQAGDTYLPSMRATPDHCLPALPTPTG